MQDDFTGGLDLSNDLYEVIRRHNLPYHETFLVLASLAANIANCDHMAEDRMLLLVKKAAELDKQLQYSELQ